MRVLRVPTFEPQAASHEFRIRGRSGNCVLREEQSRVPPRGSSCSRFENAPSRTPKSGAGPVTVPLDDAQAMKVRYRVAFLCTSLEKRLVRMLLPCYRQVEKAVERDKERCERVYSSVAQR